MTIIDEVLAERKRQSEIWGEQNHDPFKWAAILTEEVGEFCKAALHEDRDGMRYEAIHAAAVAVQIVECLDRNVWSGYEQERTIGLLKEIWVTLHELLDRDEDIEKLQGRIQDEIRLLEFSPEEQRND